jgi:hypothetical protein
MVNEVREPNLESECFVYPHIDAIWTIDQSALSPPVHFHSPEAKQHIERSSLGELARLGMVQQYKKRAHYHNEVFDYLWHYDVIRREL